MEPAKTLEHPPQTEEIQLEGDAVQSPAGAPSELIELFQVSHLRASACHFSIFDGRYLSVHSKKLARKPRRYWVDLAFLDPTPHYFVRKDLYSLYAAGGLLGVTLILALVSLWSQTPWQAQPWLPATVLTLTAAVVSLLVFLHRTCSLVRFHSQTGDAVLVELLNNNPRRAPFNAYVRTLIQHIQAVHKSERRKQHETLGAELREHRRLKEAGILSESVYERARTRILRQHKQSQSRMESAAPAAVHDSPEADIIEVTMRNGAWHTDASGSELFEEEKRSA